MRLFLLLGVIGIASCNTTTTLTDAAVAVGGCRFPSACMRTNCDCTRAGSVACQLCNPVTEPSQSCECAAFDGAAVCMTVAALCVGRSPVVCPGTARCLPAGSGCDSPGGDPPQVVASSGDAAATEARCPFVDDVCCPGPSTPMDMSILDANLDQSVTD